jgi:chromosome segregation ATPase
MQIGKGVFLVFSIVLCLVFTSSAFGMGLVTDPGAYAYFAEQVTTMSEQLAKAEEMLSKAQQQIDKVEEVKNEVNGVTQQVKGVQDQMTGTYDQGAGMVNKVKGIRDALDDTPTTLQGAREKWDSVRGFVDPSSTLSAYFKDPRSSDGSKIAELDRAYEIRQTALNNAIGEAEKTLQGMPQRFKEIEKMAAKIDQQPNAKAALDLNNRILIEMWTALEELKILTASLGEAQGLLNYSGFNQATADKRAEERAINARTPEDEGGIHGDYLRERGFNPKTIDDSDISRAMGL